MSELLKSTFWTRAFAVAFCAVRDGDGAGRSAYAVHESAAAMMIAIKARYGFFGFMVSLKLS